MALIQSKQIEYPLTGSFIDDGSGNTFISASSIVGLIDYLGSSTNLSTGSVTASVNPNNDIFLIKSGSDTFFSINKNSNTTIYSDLFSIKNYTTKENVLIVSQSVVQFATQSLLPTGNTKAGSIWFTSSSFYVGLE
jgi:phage tail sheath protein FI